MSRVRVLVVDDSAFARKVLREVLSADARIEVVGTARDGLDALEKVASLAPDVVALDLVMPNLDGLGFLEALRERPDPPRVVVVTSAEVRGEAAITALELGAIDIVQKPTALATDRLYELGAPLVANVLAAAQARSPAAPAAGPTRTRAPTRVRPAVAGAPEVLVLGTSTGGPKALHDLLPRIPADFPLPIAIVLHIPVGYTQALAERLDARCALEVVEARDGLGLVPGRVILARAGVHLVCARGPEGPRVRLETRPDDSLHRPSVDRLFESAAAVFGPRVLAVVLTGMGDDGRAGAAAVRAAGGTVLTEDESTCVVYGMPRSVVEAGLSSEVVPGDAMAEAVVRYAGAARGA